MFRRLISMMLAALLLLTGSAPAMAEFTNAERIAPDEPIVTDAEYFHITVTYDSENDVSRYAVAVKDGAPVTAQDLLFTLYVYLDPSCTAETDLAEQSVSGLRSYRLQLTPQQIDEGLRIMKAIEEAGPDHVPDKADGWSAEIQKTYWQLADARARAGDAEFPVLAQQIVDFCTARLTPGSKGALGFTAEEILADDALKTAYTFSQWGYARFKDGILTAVRSGNAWNLAAGEAPGIADFAAELKLIYGGDFYACWSMECPDPAAYAPVLPELEDPFLLACYSGAGSTISSISGIALLDERTVEISLGGIDMRSDHALLSVPMLTLSACGEASLWNPEAGLYGHPFGDVSAVDMSSGVKLYSSAAEAHFSMN